MSRSIEHTTLPWQLEWADVDPTVWAAPANLEQVALDLAWEAILDTPLSVGGEARKKPRRGTRDGVIDGDDGTWRQRVEGAIGLAFARRFGPWANGWRWARDEGSIGGGVISAWCCASHSVQPRGEKDPTPTTKRAARALLEWRAWLETLQRTFRDLDPRALVEPGCSADDQKAAIALRLDAACGELVALVVEQTGAGDAWYNHMAQVLAWYLQSQGASVDASHSAADAAVSGRFESWSGPSDEVLAAARADWTRPARLALPR